MKKGIICNAIIALWCIVCAVACGEPEKPAPEVKSGERTVLVYQVASNTGLDEYSFSDLSEMKLGMSDGSITNAGGRLLVYNHSYGNAAVLLDVTPAGLDTLKVYDTSLTSVHAARMLEVFDDMEEFAPAKDYGLILWGHGSGWFQDGISDYVPEQRRSYGGEGRSKWMNISTLAEVLEVSPGFSFVYFDCCYMSSVEVAYELRHTTPYIAGCVSELPGEGMPYDLNLKYFFAPGKADIIGAAASTFAFYDEWKTMGSRPGFTPASFSNRNATMSVIATEGLDELAAAAKTIYERTPNSYPAGFVPQRFDRRSIVNAYYFDLGQYVEALCLDGDAERFEGAAEALAAYKAAQAKCVPYQATMPMIFGGEFRVDYHCGLSTYILRSKSLERSNNYNTLEWYDDVASYINIEN